MTAHRQLGQRVAVHQPGLPQNNCPPAVSPTAAAATATPSPRRSSSPGTAEFKKRCAWRSEWETIEQAPTKIGDYIQHYHHRPHFGIGYRTPTEIAATWRP